jgi:hypothetical protein
MCFYMYACIFYDHSKKLAHMILEVKNPRSAGGSLQTQKSPWHSSCPSIKVWRPRELIMIWIPDQETMAGEDWYLRLKSQAERNSYFHSDFSSVQALVGWMRLIRMQECNVLYSIYRFHYYSYWYSILSILLEIMFS